MVVLGDGWVDEDGQSNNRKRKPQQIQFEVVKGGKEPRKNNLQWGGWDAK